MSLRKPAACALTLAVLLAFFPWPAAALDTPSLTGFSATSTSVTFSWSAVSGAEGYWPCLYDEKGTGLQSGGIGKVYQYTFSNLSPNTTYLVAVWAAKEDASEISNGYAGKLFTTAPAISSVAAIRATDIKQTSATLTWTSETLPSGCTYRLERVSPSWSDNLSIASFTATDLAPGTTYTYRYCLYRESDNAYSDYRSTTFTTAPATPAKPDNFAVTNRTGNSITLSWSSAYACQVVRTNSTYTASYESKPVSGTSTVFSGLSAGTEYFFKIQAVNGSQVSAWAQTSGVTTPAKPGNPVQTGSSAGSVYLSWDAPSGSVDSYVLRLAGGAGAGTFTTTTAAPSWEITGLAPGTEYTVTVASRLKGLESEQTAPLKVSTLSSDSVAVPQGIRVTGVTRTSVSLEWDGQPDTDGFLIYRSDSADGSYTEVGEVKGSTAFTDSGLKQGTTYYYRIRAYRFLGQSLTKQWSVDSNPVIAKTAAPQVPDPPKDLSARYQDDLSVMVIWKASENATGYVVYRSNEPDGKFVEAATVKGTNRWTDTAASTDREWYYSVSAVNESGESKQCTPVRAVIPEEMETITEFLLTADSVSAEGAALSWDAVEGAVIYYIYRSFAENSDYSLVASVTDTNYTDSELPASTELYYQISACDALNREVGVSNILLVMTPAAPPAKQSAGQDTAVSGNSSSKLPYAIVLGGLAFIVLVLIVLVPVSSARHTRRVRKTQRKRTAVRGKPPVSLASSRKAPARVSRMRKSG